MSVRRIVLVAAEGREFAGIVRLTGGMALNWPIQFARAAEFGGHRAVLVANGPGPALAARALSVALEHEQPDAVISTGVCGALDPRLGVGDIIVADRVVDGARNLDYSTLPIASARRFVSGPVVSVDRVACTISDKSSLRALGGIAVEMEAAGVASLASDKALPLYCIRAVSDGAEQDLVLNFNEYRDQDGRFSRSRIAAAALRQPWSRIPALIRLDRDSRRASEALGDFLVDCRF